MVPHRHSTSIHDRHERIAGPEVPGGHVATARMDSMIGCADEYTSGFRGDFKSWAAVDASSGLHVAPDSSAVSVIVGQNARDSAGESVCCGESSMLTFYMHVSAHTIGRSAGDTGAAAHAEHPALASGDLPFGGGAVVGCDRQAETGVRGQRVADGAAVAVRQALRVAGRHDPSVRVVQESVEDEVTRDAGGLALLRRHGDDQPAVGGVAEPHQLLVDQVQGGGGDGARVDVRGELPGGVEAALPFAGVAHLEEGCPHVHGGLRGSARRRWGRGRVDRASR